MKKKNIYSIYVYTTGQKFYNTPMFPVFIEM